MFKLACDNAALLLIVLKLMRQQFDGYASWLFDDLLRRLSAGRRSGCPGCQERWWDSLLRLVARL